MDLIAYLKCLRRKLRESAAETLADLGPQYRCGFDDCAVVDPKRLDARLESLVDDVRRIKRLEAELAWPLLDDPRAWSATAEIECDESRLEDWVRLIRTIVASGDCLHVHSLRNGLKNLIRELDAAEERFERTAAKELRACAPPETLAKLGIRAERSRAFGATL